MAEQTLEVDAQEAVSGLVVKIQMRGATRAMLRLRFAMWMIRTAGRVAGVKEIIIFNDDYGVVRAGSPEAVGIQHVTVDGMVQDGVVAAKPGAFGWAEHYTGLMEDGKIETRRRYGLVHLKKIEPSPFRLLLEEAAQLFRTYELHHRAEALDPDVARGRLEKASRNAEIARRIEDALLSAN